MPKSLVFFTLLACLFLSVVGGALLAYFELLPGRINVEALSGSVEPSLLPDTQRSLHSAHAKHPLRAENFYRSELPQQAGVIRYDPVRAANGYTLYAPVGPGFPIRLIDMGGNTVYEWTLENTLWPAKSRSMQREKVSGAATVTLNAQLLPKGDLLVVTDVAEENEQSGGIVRLDKDSNVLWQYSGLVNAADLSSDGSIYALLREPHTQPWPGLENIQPPFYDEIIVELDAGGNELRTISLLAAIQNSSFEYLLQYVSADSHGGQLLGANSIQHLNAVAAAKLPDTKADDILVSFGALDTLAVIDIEQVVVKWAIRGSWHLQHAAEVLASGNILLFDNFGDLRNGGRSRVLEIDPISLETIWEFPRDTGVDLFTSGQGSQQRLLNGNTIISEAYGGRLLEIAPDGDVVWEYYAPEVIAVSDSKYVSHAVFPQRYLPDQLEFLEMSAGGSK